VQYRLVDLSAFIGSPQWAQRAARAAALDAVRLAVRALVTQWFEQYWPSGR
jgi:hypothetical protein